MSTTFALQTRRKLLSLVGGDDAGILSVLGANFSAGFVAGTLAAGATCPLDVAKTRRQIEVCFIRFWVGHIFLYFLFKFQRERRRGVENFTRLILIYFFSGDTFYMHASAHLVLLCHVFCKMFCRWIMSEHWKWPRDIHWWRSGGMP